MSLLSIGFFELSELNTSVGDCSFYVTVPINRWFPIVFSVLRRCCFSCCRLQACSLVESNPLSGIYNNIFSTLSVCHSTVCSDVKSMVLISSDKAVRPSNVMGATKEYVS